MSERGGVVTQGWRPVRPRLRVLHVVLSWLVGAASLMLAAVVLPGVTVAGFGGALVVAAAVGLLNALAPPVLAALRLPATLVLGFLLVLVLDALMIEWASADRRRARGLRLRLGAAHGAARGGRGRLAGSAARDRRQGRIFAARDPADRPASGRAGTPTSRGSCFSRSTAWGCRCCSGRCGTAAPPRWRAGCGTAIACPSGRPTSPRRPAPARRASCSGPTRTSRRSAGWRRSGRLITARARATAPRSSGAWRAARAARRRRGESRQPALRRGGGADPHRQPHAAEKKANPGYRAFLANGYNVTRLLVLFGWEVGLECPPPTRQRRRDVLPRGHRGGIYPLMRAAMCVVVPELIVHGVLTDIMRGRPAVYATFASYDEVAHHSGLERADTLEALRKLDRQLGASRARCATPRVPISWWCSQTTDRPRGRRSSSATATGWTARRALAGGWERPRVAAGDTTKDRRPGSGRSHRAGRSESVAAPTAWPVATRSCWARGISDSCI